MTLSWVISKKGPVDILIENAERQISAIDWIVGLLEVRETGVPVLSIFWKGSNRLIRSGNVRG